MEDLELEAQYEASTFFLFDLNGVYARVPKFQSFYKHHTDMKDLIIENIMSIW